MDVKVTRIDPFAFFLEWLRERVLDYVQKAAHSHTQETIKEFIDGITAKLSEGV